MITVYAENIKTGEVLELGEFPTMEEAQWNIDNNIEFDEDDNPVTSRIQNSFQHVHDRGIFP